jgi:hypothetical protein
VVLRDFEWIFKVGGPAVGLPTRALAETSLLRPLGRDNH